VPILVKMGAISPTMTSGHVVEWKVKVGDKVKEGDTIADVQTDKAVMPLESFDEGTVAQLLVAPGEEVPVGQDVLLLAAKGEDPKAIAGASTKVAAPASSKASPASANGQGQEAVASTPGHERAWEEPIAHEIPVASNGGRVKSSPLARKVAAAERVDIGSVKGTGPGGRVVRSDVEGFLKTRGTSPAPTPSARPSGAPTRPIVGDEVIKLNRMQTTIAARMTEAKRVAPDIHVTVDIRIDSLVAIRERLNNSLAKEKIKLSVGDFVTKAVALALRRHPAVNATFDGETLTRRGEVNVGIAVALPEGLIVPVLKNADTLGLREIRTGSEKLYEAARSMKLTGDQMTGGTFTISNLGMYGVREFDAILNLPQVGILAVGAAEKRPVVEGDKLVVGTVMTVTLTADHRVVNGADAAEFLRTLKGLLEEPASMLL
jgi:pyruvate dehydrogenase E2 component (dihydrolipoamide acetyltransferase)